MRVGRFILFLIGILPVLFFLKFYLFYKDYSRFHEIVDLSSFLIYLILCVLAIRFFIKKKWTIPINVSFFFFLLLLLEFTAYLLLGLPIKQWKGYDVIEMPEGHKNNYMGNIPWADSVLHDVQIMEGDTFANSFYSIDSLSRRITPGYERSKSKHAIFFGCSVCFGFGLKDDETIPYYFQSIASDYNSYNYAYNGYGTQHMLSLLEHEDLSKQVKEKEGIGVYVFIWSHIRRVIGDYQVYTGWGHTMPFYDIEGEELLFKGNFKQGRPMLSEMYELLNKSYTVKLFQLNFPLKTNARHYALVAEIISASKSKYDKTFANDNFTVIIYPDIWDELDDARLDLFIKELEEREIHYIDLSENKYLIKDSYILMDGHPNAKSNAEFSQKIIDEMKLNER